LVGIEWLIDAVGSDPRGRFLIDLLRLLRTEADAEMAGVDHAWEDYYHVGNPFEFHGKPMEPKYDSGDSSGTVHLLRHGVDIGEAMKTGALWWRVGGKGGADADADGWKSAWRALEFAERYLHMADGMYWADEEVAGSATPSRGTETCSVVETMFSMRTAYEITGNITFMDRLERLAFNSLPAALWPDATANVCVERTPA
jgi:hypothetical protein